MYNMVLDRVFSIVVMETHVPAIKALHIAACVYSVRVVTNGSS